MDIQGKGFEHLELVSNFTPKGRFELISVI